LKKGYQVASTSYEHESLVYNAKQVKLDRLEECMAKGAQLVAHVLVKKSANGGLQSLLERDRGKKQPGKDALQNPPHTVGS
jgi:hypothetical protein